MAEQEKKRSALRIIANIVPNEHCKNWHVNIPICNTRIAAFDFPMDWNSSFRKKELDEVGPVGTELIKKLSDLPGVDHLSIQRYSLQVVIGEAFEWNGIEEYIVAALKECFGDRWQEVEVETKDVRHLYERDPDDF